MVAIAWGFGSAIIITVLPLSESADEINMVLSGLFNWITGREPNRPHPDEEKELDTTKGADIDDTTHVKAAPGTPTKEDEVVEPDSQIIEA